MNGNTKRLWRLGAGGTALVAAMAATLGCSGSMTPSQVGSETHFLRACDSKCGSGLECIKGLCTRSCLVAKDSCADLAADAACTDRSIEPGAVAVCDLACASDTDCKKLGSDYECTGGFCRGQALATSSGASCRVAHVEYPSGSTNVPAPIGCGQCSCNDGELDCSQVSVDCATGGLIQECPQGTLASDPVSERWSFIAGDVLTVAVSYSGGCARHDFRVCYGPQFLESYPVQVPLRLVHDAHGDSCEAGIHATLRFDLGALGAAYMRAYQSNGGIVNTNHGSYVFGQTSCDEYETAVKNQTGRLASYFDVSCASDSDCTYTPLSTSCNSACSGIVSTSATGQSGVTHTEAAVAIMSLDQRTCGGWASNGCTTEAAVLCDLGPLGCVNGKCQVVP